MKKFFTGKVKLILAAALCLAIVLAVVSVATSGATVGEKVVGVGYALEIVETFLTTQFEGGRHQRRIDKITAIEKKYCK